MSLTVVAEAITAPIMDDPPMPTTSRNGRPEQSTQKKQAVAGLVVEGLMLVSVLMVLLLAWSHAPTGLELADWYPHDSSDSPRLWKAAPIATTPLPTTTTRYINRSAEVSVLVGAELVAQSPLLDWTLSTLLKPALVDAVIAIGLHSIGVPLFFSASKWLAPYGHAGWTMRQRFVGATRYLKRLATATSKGGLAVARRTTSSTTTTTKTLPRLWDTSKKAVQHLYKKRARYSVASELTNLVPPEPKNNGSKTTIDMEMESED